jgi:hypothetical protein
MQGESAMKRSALLAAAVVLLFASTTLLAQDRRPGSSDGGRGTPGNSPSVSTSNSSVSQSPSVSMGGSSRGSYMDSPSYIPRGGGYYGGGGSAAPAPKLTGTSFYSSTMYFTSQDFYWYLGSRYGFSPFYFRRFYRNVEPLVNPYIASLTLRQPMALSTRMLAAIDDLEALVRDRQAGKNVPAELIEQKGEEIRGLAKEIRQDESVNYFEHRKDRNLLKGLDDMDTLEAIAQLRAFANDLNTQLKNLYTNARPVVTVDSLSQPSFQSLSKGIEKLTKSIESSAKRI